MSGKGRRVATLLAGAALAASAWTGVATAAPAQASPAQCQAASQQLNGLFQRFSQGSTLLGSLTGAQAGQAQQQLAGLQQQINTFYAQFTAACSSFVPSQATGGTTTTTSTTTGTTTTSTATPTTTTTTPSTGGTTATGGVVGTADRDCPSFASQPEAQAYFVSIGGSAANNADRLDRDRDGLACEENTAGTAAVAGGSTSQMAVVPSGGVATGDGSFGG